MKKFYIDNEEIKEEGDFRKRLEDAIYSECECTYDDDIDETNEDVKIWSLTYSPSQVLKEVDQIAYRCGLDDYFNYRLEDALYELDNGWEVEFNCYNFKIEEVDDDEEEDEEEDDEDE